MKLLWRLILFVLIITAINVATYFLLRSNLAAGVYNPQADSIGIPFSAGVDLSKYILLWLAPICAVTSLDRIYRVSAQHQKLRNWIVAAIALAYLWLAWLFFSWGVAFLRPDHYILAALCTIAALVPIFMGAADIRRVRSNNSCMDSSVKQSLP